MPGPAGNGSTAARGVSLMIQATVALSEWADVLTDADRRGLTPVFRTNMTTHGGPSGEDLSAYPVWSGPAFLLGDLAARMDDPVDRAVVLDAAHAVERVPELLGIGPHLLASGIRR